MNKKDYTVFKANTTRPHVMVCDQCGHEFLTKSVKIDSTVVQAKTTSVVAEYFNCPSCGYSYLFNIKDGTSQSLLNDFIEARKRWYKQTQKAGDVNCTNLYNIMCTKMERYQRHQKKLLERYAPTFEVLKNGKEK